MREEPQILQTVWMISRTQGYAAKQKDANIARIEERKHLKEHVKERKIVEQRDDFVRWEDGYEVCGATVSEDARSFDGIQYRTISKFYIKVSLLTRIRRWLKQ